MPEEEQSPTPLKVTTSFQLSPNLKRRIEEIADSTGVAQQTIIVRALTAYFERLDRRAWGTIDEDDLYDPHAYFTHGSDNKGHSSEIRVLIPKWLRGEMQQLIESGAIPEYRTVQHIARDGIYHRTKYVTQRIEMEGLERAIDTAMLLSDEQRLHDQEVEAVNLIATMEKNLKVLLAAAEETGNYSRLEEYIGDRATKAGVVPESQRRHYETLLAQYRRQLRNRKETDDERHPYVEPVEAIEFEPIRETVEAVEPGEEPTDDSDPAFYL